MATASLRPLSIGEILDAALKVVIRHWKPLMLAVIVPILPLTILSVLLTASLETDLSQFETSGDPSDIEASFWVSAGLGSLVSYLTTFIVQAVCFKAVADAWLGAEPSAGRSWRFALQRTFALLAMVSLMLVTFLLGLIACGIPTIWLSVMWSVATAALLFERLGPVKALGRSFALLKQRFWATLLLLIITTLLTFFVTAVVQGIPSGLTTVLAPDNEIATAVTDIIFGTIGSAMVLPISAAVFAILYFDQRVRKEGFDVQLLAEGLGAAYDPNAPIPAPLRPDPNAAPPQGWAPQPPPGYWQPPPPPGWQPPPQQYGGGWSAPAHDAPPLRWGPAAGPPQDERPPEESPWMAPGPPASGGWAPPAGAAPNDRLWGPREDAPARPPTGGSGSPDGEDRWAPAPADDESPTARVGDDAPPAWGTPPSPGDDSPTAPIAGDSPADDAPTAPLGDDAPASPDDAPPAPRWGASSPFGDSPWEDKPDEDDQRRKRDEDWQPPEEPRGPGGL